jgi:hypothetical protein
VASEEAVAVEEVVLLPADSVVAVAEEASVTEVAVVALPVEAVVLPEVVAAAEAQDAVASVPVLRFSLFLTIVSRAFLFCAVKMMPSSLRT